MVWLTLVLGIILANPVHNARRDPNKVVKWTWGSATSRQNDAHMFSYGEGAGDEKMDIGDLPTVRSAYRKPWDAIKLFADGHIELVNQHVTPRYTGFIAPFHIPHSEITSGTVWFRETSDQPSLDLVQSEINDVFGDDGFTSDPDAMIVVTWVLADVTPDYIECNEENIANNEEFCDCLERTAIHNHLACECRYFPTNRPTYLCSVIHYTTDLRAAQCIPDGYHGVGYDRFRYCECLSRGGSPDAAWCALSQFNLFFFSPVGNAESCDLCQCRSDRGDMNYCRCHSINSYIKMGWLKCFMTMIILNNSNLHETSTVPLPDQLTEFDLIEELLDRDFHRRIWLCEEEDLDLDYCKCIKTRTAGDRDDEIYCKCAVYSAGGGQDMCKCLDDEGYGGSESCAGGSAVGPGNSLNMPIEFESSMNTFQAVIVYNELQTFVYFTYFTLHHSDKDVTTKVGIQNTQTSTFSGYTHPYPDDASLINFLLHDSNMGDPGVWIYRLDRNVTESIWTPTNSTIPGFYG